MIHHNSFLQNSAVIGVNAIKLYLFTNLPYSTAFSSSNMICASVQISSNTFKQNVGCFNTIGSIQAVCFTESKDSDPSLQPTHYSSPSPMSSSSSENLSKAGIVTFSTENIVSLPSSGESIDQNKFLLKGNMYDENFAGAQAGIVEVVNVRRLHIQSDSFVNNYGLFKEAMDKYGTITTTGDKLVDGSLPGAWRLSAFFGETGQGKTLQEIVSTASLQNHYPVAPLVIDGSLYAHVDGVTFDNNAMQELTQSQVISFYPAGAITVRRSQGKIFLNSLTIKNYKGIDLIKLETILGASEFAYVQSKTPQERSSSGIVSTSVSLPNYVVDYGFKNQLVKFAKPSPSSATDFQNYFDLVQLDTLKVSNILQYDPLNTLAALTEFDTD